MASNQQLRLPLGTFTRPEKHPSRGGNAYSQEVRAEVITRWQLGLPLVTPELTLLRQQYKYPSLQRCLAWIEQFRTVGHFRPKCPTGNHEAYRDIRGQALVRLALYRTVHPEAPISHVRAFLFNMDPTVVPYYPSAVVRAELLLGLRMKAASTTCERAYWPINIHKRQRYWTMPYPFGRADVRTQDMIDMDQCGMKIEATNPHYGKSLSWERCHFEGSYNRDKKLNVMMAVSADRNYDMEWHDCWPQEEGGTNLFRLLVFFTRVMDRLDIDYPGRSFCFTMDNLNIHHNPILQNLITSRGHRYLYRAPYWSVDGPMEYVFNTLHTLLLMFFRDCEDLDELANRIDLTIPQMRGFVRYSLHVGFPDN